VQEGLDRSFLHPAFVMSQSSFRSSSVLNFLISTSFLLAVSVSDVLEVRSGCLRRLRCWRFPLALINLLRDLRPSTEQGGLYAKGEGTRNVKQLVRAAHEQAERRMKGLYNVHCSNSSCNIVRAVITESHSREYLMKFNIHVTQKVDGSIRKLSFVMI